MQFEATYSEHVTLLDGTDVHLRMIRPTDKELMKRGFERLSPESRYRRFMGAKSMLTDAELEYLTNVDGVNHLAIVATHVGSDGCEEGLAVARFVRVADRPTAAEAAVTVLDEWQHKRLGSILLDRLALAARERGITHFRAVAMPTNAPIRALLKELGDAVTIGHDGDQIIVDVSLEEAAEREAQLPPGPLRRILRAAAEASALDRNG